MALQMAKYCSRQQFSKKGACMNCFKTQVKLLRVSKLAAAILALGLVTACEKPINPNDLPVSYFADPKNIGDSNGNEPCSVASAQAILKSGLPYPNYGTKDELASDGITINKRITTVDYWLCGTRFVFPVELSTTDSYPLHHPSRYRGLVGSLPNFYPKGSPAESIDGMGGRVDVRFEFSMEPRFTDNWEKSPRSISEGIEVVKARYEEILKTSPEYPGTVTISFRDDLDMTEILLERQGFKLEATYFPKTELKDFSEKVSQIGCRIRHEPKPAKNYGGRGWQCGSGIPINQNVYAGIHIYVSHLAQMPSIYNQVKQVIINAKKAGE
jgi:hypothetical protein